MDKSTYQLRGKLVSLRLFRHGKTPPSLYSTEILYERGFPVLAIEYGNIEEPADQVLESFPRLRISNRFARFLPRRLRMPFIFISTGVKLFWRITWEGLPRLIIAHGLQEQWIAYQLFRFFGVRFGVHVHEGYDEGERLSPLNRWLFRKEKNVLPAASFLIFPEAERARLYRDRYGFTCPSFIVFNAPRQRSLETNARDLRVALNLSNDAILLGYMGGLGETNCLEPCIRALSELPRVHFLLWGWGDATYMAQLKQSAEEMGVTDRVHFLGVADDKWACLAGCDFGYCVYESNNFRLRHQATASNKLLECVSLGVPVLTSSSSSFCAFLERYPVGVAAPDLTVAGIREGLHSLVYDANGRERRRLVSRKAGLIELNYEAQYGPVADCLKSYFPKQFAEDCQNVPWRRRLWCIFSPRRFFPVLSSQPTQSMVRDFSRSS